MGITPSPHRHVVDHTVGRNADYLVRFPVLSALLDINATEDQVCELMAITAIMSDIDGTPRFMETISDTDEVVALVSDQADTLEMSETINTVTAASTDSSQLLETYEQSFNSSPHPMQSNERRRRGSRTGLRRAHQSFATEMETQFNQLYQHYFLHTDNDETMLMENELSSSTHRNAYMNNNNNNELLAETIHHQANSSTQRVIQSLRNHLRFLREIRNRRAALGIRSPYVDITETHRLQSDTIQGSRQHRRWGMILSRYSFDEDFIEARNNNSITTPLPSHTHWLATSTTSSSPYMNNNNNNNQRQQQSRTGESDYSENDTDTTTRHTLVAHGQYRRLQSPETFHSIIRESNQARYPHPHSPNSNLLEQRSPSSPDLASIHGSLGGTSTI
jgi:hypothetical protein